LKIPYSEQELVDACIELAARAERSLREGRPTCGRSRSWATARWASARRTRPAWRFTAWDWGAYLGDKGIRDGIRAKVSSITRMHVNVNMVRGKITGQYVNSILAKREAVLGG